MIEGLAKSMKKILAVASAGGHWIQLRRMAPAYQDQDCVYVTTNPGYRGDVGDSPYYAVRDASLWNKWSLLILAIQIFFIVLRFRPDVVISTGAAPGYFAIRFGRWFGARTIWVDSIANVEILSLSGQKVGKYADLWLTQWEHLSSTEGPQYQGSVL